MNFENQNNEGKNRPGTNNENAELQAALQEMENISDVKPVNKGFSVTVISFFVALLILPTLIWGALHLFSPATVQNLSFDTGENRNMASFPNKFNPKTFTSQVESWYNDHVPFRSVLYAAQSEMLLALEKPYTDTLYPALIKLFYSNTQVPSDPNGNNGGFFDPLGTEETESAEPTETETLPSFDETETETIPEFDTEDDFSDCQHVLATEGEILKEATCSEFGIMGYPCSKCEYVKKEYTAKAAHTLSDKSSVIQEATCSEYGIIGYSCTACSYVKKEYSHKTAHELKDDAPTLPKRCGDKYQLTQSCVNCDFKESKTAEKAHTLGKVVKVVTPSISNYGYTLVECVDCKCHYRTQLSDKLYDTSYLPPVYGSKRGIIGRNNWLFYGNENSEGYYQGTNLLSNEELFNYLNTLQTLKNICDQKGIKLVIALFPNKELVYSEYMPTYTVNSEKRVAKWTNYVKKNSDINVVYPLNKLLESKPLWDVYLKFDTHWNNAGAFIGYQEILKSLGLETTDLRNLPVTEYAHNSGDLFSYVEVNKEDYLNSGGSLNYTIQYKPDVKVDVLYNTGSGNSVVKHTSSDGINDMKFVMLCDSYRFAMAPFIEKDFTESVLTHRSEVGQPYVVNAIRTADILVIAAVERYDANVIQTANTIIQYLSQ